MGERDIFISSCSRRQLARRRPGGMVVRGRRGGLPGVGLSADVFGLSLLALLLVALVALAALAAGMLVAGGT